MSNWEMMEEPNDKQLRPEVMAFAQLMEARLREKDEDKGQSWKNSSLPNLEVHASSKMRLIEITTDDLEAAAHAIDLANYCMMLADVAGALREGIEIANGEPHH